MAAYIVQGISKRGIINRGRFPTIFINRFLKYRHALPRIWLRTGKRVSGDIEQMFSQDRGVMRRTGKEYRIKAVRFVPVLAIRIVRSQTSCRYPSPAGITRLTETVKSLF